MYELDTFKSKIDAAIVAGKTARQQREQNYLETKKAEAEKQRLAEQKIVQSNLEQLPNKVYTSASIGQKYCVVCDIPREHWKHAECTDGYRSVFILPGPYGHLQDALKKMGYSTQTVFREVSNREDTMNHFLEELCELRITL